MIKSTESKRLLYIVPTTQKYSELWKYIFNITLFVFSFQLALAENLTRCV